MVTTAPMTTVAVEPAATVEAKSRTVITTKRWTDDDAEANWRNIYDRARRWWRVIVSWRGRAVRLNHISAGVRALRGAKPECEHCQCNNETFFPHDRIFLQLFCRFNPTMTTKLPGKIARMFLATETSVYTDFQVVVATSLCDVGATACQFRDASAWCATPAL